MNAEATKRMRDPIYAGRFPDQEAMAVVPPSARPYWIPIFDTATLYGAGGLPAGQTGENNFQLGADFWWCASLFAPAVIQAFAVQLFRIQKDQDGNQDTFRYEKTPISGANFFGTNTTGLQAATPFYLRRPVYFSAGTEILIRVQNTFTIGGIPSALKTQLVLFGYLQGAGR